MCDLSDIDLTRKFLKDRLLRDLTTFRGHETDRKHIYDLLTRTAVLGESNSVLLIGPRGCGKTTLINSVLYELLNKDEFSKNTLIVKLNGLVHTDDRRALRSITKQLNLDNVCNGKIFGSFAENLSFLLLSLKSGNRNSSKSTIFILDEFDLFCLHHNQTLLYNLFDISQSSQSPICVIGITCRLDVVELLEKRVKSRFSHRQIFLLPESDNIKGRINLFKELLKLPTAQEAKLLHNQRPDLKSIKNSELYNFYSNFDPCNYTFNKNYINIWNHQIDNLIDDKIVIKSLERLYEYDVLESGFKKILFQLVNSLNTEKMCLTSEDIKKVILRYENDDKIFLLLSLSVLELCLLITIRHHSEIYDRDPFNYEIILSRFKKFANSSTIMQNIDKNVILKSFEHIKNLEFILPITTNVSRIQKEYQMYKLALTFGQINQAVNKYPSLPTEVAQWAQSSLN